MTPYSGPMTKTTVHRTCTICEATCGIDVEVLDGEAVRITGDREDSFSAGHICPKAHGLLDLHRDPDRLRTPVRRTDDGWVEISWEDAIELAARELGRVRDEHGDDAVALYRGNPTVHDAQSILYWNVMQRALPTRNKYSAGSLDTWPRFVQAHLMYGGYLNTPVPDIDRSDYFLMLGANPIESHGSLMTAPGMKKRLDALRKRGGRLVVVDPRRSETADRADEHVSVLPGGDAALLLGMLHCLFAEDRVELGAAEGLVRDLDEVREIVARYSPEVVAPVCGVDPETVRRLVREFAAARSAIAYGRMGTCVQQFGTVACWAIDLLNILTGNLDRPGGSMFANPAIHLGFVAGTKNGEAAIGRDQSRVSGYDEVFGEFPIAAFAEEMDTPGEGQVRALAIIAGNPVSSAPNSDRIDAALGSLEFIVAFDYYINETTRHANLILPPTAPLAHDTYDIALLHFAVRNHAKWSPAAVEAGEGERPVWRVLLDISRRLMGLGEIPLEQVDSIVLGQFAALALAGSRLEGRVTPEEAVSMLGDEPGPRRVIDLLLRAGPYGDEFGQRPDGLTLQKLADNPHGLDFGALEPALPDVLRTADGAIPLAPERIVRDLPRLDRFIEERSSGAGPASVLLIGRRDVRSMNSWLHNLPSLAKGKVRCTLQVHPSDAERLELENEGWAQLEGRVGTLLAQVEISDRMTEGVVSLPHGWGHDLPGVQLGVARKQSGVNTNRVVDDREVDVPSGTSVLNGVRVELKAVPGL